MFVNRFKSRALFVTVFTTLGHISSSTRFASCEQNDDWVDKITRTTKNFVRDTAKNFVYKKFGEGPSFDTLVSKVSNQVEDVLGGGALPQIGFGFVMGYSSGFCIKRASKIIAFSIGGIFIIAQTMAYNGYVTINYDKLKRDFEKQLDINNDGKIDNNDLSLMAKIINKVVGFHLPSGSGFATGLVLGLRS